MATVEEPRPVSRYDTFLSSRLTKARNRIRAIDLGIAALGLIGGTLAYGVIMVLLDRSLALPAWGRQAALILYLLAAGIYIARVVLRPLLRTVNPYYAA